MNDPVRSSEGVGVYEVGKTARIARRAELDPRSIHFGPLHPPGITSRGSGRPQARNEPGPVGAQNEAGFNAQHSVIKAQEITTRIVERGHNTYPAHAEGAAVHGPAYASA